jgi:hypothetical protein
MARPVKNYCEYFPHDRDMRNHRKIKAIRTKFKITGYGIWCMILEYLTGIDGNVFEYSDVEMELMAGDFGVSATEIRDVIDYCIKLELLFLKDDFIQSESLDERLKPVYDKRGVSKEKSKKQSRIYGKFSSNKAAINGVSVTEKPQSKVKESKVKEIMQQPAEKEEITIVGTDLAVDTARIVWTDQKWREQLCMAHTMPEDDLKKWMAQFNASVANDTMPDFNAGKYKKLFGGWLNTQKGKGYKLEKNNHQSPQLRKLT